MKDAGVWFYGRVFGGGFVDGVDVYWMCICGALDMEFFLYDFILLFFVSFYFDSFHSFDFF